MHLRATRRDAGSAVLAPRSHQLPQSIDLSGRGRAAAGISGVPFRAAAARHAPHRPRGKRRPIVRALRAGGQGRSSLPSPARLRAGRGRATRSRAGLRRVRAGGSREEVARRRGVPPARGRPVVAGALCAGEFSSTRLSMSTSFVGERVPSSSPPVARRVVDLRRLARPELLAELLPAIRQARETGLPVRRDALRLDDERNVSIEAVPLAGAERRSSLSDPPRRRIPPPKSQLSPGVVDHHATRVREGPPARSATARDRNPA